MPKPARTHPTRSAAGGPSKSPSAMIAPATTTAPITALGAGLPAPRPSAPTLLLPSAPAPQLRFFRWEIRGAVDQPDLRSPDRRPVRDVQGRAGYRKRSPDGIEVH